MNGIIVLSFVATSAPQNVFEIHFFFACIGNF